MNTASQTPDYDAFGDPAVGGRSRLSATRRARTVAVAMFWTVAMLLIAGRIYQNEAAPQAHAMEMASR